MVTASPAATGDGPGWRERAYRRARRFVTNCIRIYLVVLLLLFLLENKLIFPAPRFPSGDWQATWLEYEDVNFVSADGTKLHGWYLDHPSPKAYLLYCHGNGEHVAYVAPVVEELRSTLGVAVFAFDYRGYGRSEGSANEAGILADARAAHQWLTERAGVEPDQILLMGRSIGGAVAVDLAAEHHSRAMILESTFPNLPDVAARLHWWAPVRWLMRTRLDSAQKISRFDGSLLQSHGAADNMIPLSYGRRLFDAAPTADKHFLVFDGLGHNDYPPDEYYEQLREFVDRITSGDRQ
ncbi:MAG: alpha/beta fold hydrolase [Planctomycetota bacterium]|nr:alpha/beta fold hydrolase [Planctomycetota bacterium]